MKLKSLILGSVAAAGLSTGAMAADLNTVLTSLNVCDALGLSGLTLSSTATDDTAATCLQITGSVDYRFRWGDYNGTLLQTTLQRNGTNVNIIDNDGVSPLELDWMTRARAWVQFVGTSDTSVGPASATIRLNYSNTTTVLNETAAPADTTVITWGVDRAFVSIGSGTVLTAGLRTESIANLDDDEPYLALVNLFNADNAGGVLYRTSGAQNMPTAGQVVQITSDLGNGVSVSGALENINGTAVNAGTAIGVLAYSGDNVSAHITGLAGGVLDGTVENWAVHAGATVELDMFNLRGAFAADDSGYWNVLGTAEATFDMFTLAAAAEASFGNEVGFGLSASADVTDTVTINAGFAWFDTNTTIANNSNYRAAIELVADVTETITLSGEVGADVTEFGGGSTTGYFAGSVDWAPGGDYEASVGVEVNSIGGYRFSFDASKEIN